jgi:hypothetical protein
MPLYSSESNPKILPIPAGGALYNNREFKKRFESLADWQIGSIINILKMVTCKQGTSVALGLTGIVLGALTIGLYSILYDAILQTVSIYVVTSILGSCSTAKIFWGKVTCKVPEKLVGKKIVRLGGRAPAGRYECWQFFLLPDTFKHFTKSSYSF